MTAAEMPLIIFGGDARECDRHGYTVNVPVSKLIYIHGKNATREAMEGLEPDSHRWACIGTWNLQPKVVAAWERFVSKVRRCPECESRLTRSAPGVWKCLHCAGAGVRSLAEVDDALQVLRKKAEAVYDEFEILRGHLQRVNSALKATGLTFEELNQALLTK